jgi:hypothetical protein
VIPFLNLGEGVASVWPEVAAEFSAATATGALSEPFEPEPFASPAPPPQASSKALIAIVAIVIIFISVVLFLQI